MFSWVIIIVIIFIFPNSTFQASTVPTPIQFSANLSNIVIPQADIVGSLINVIHEFVSQSTRNNPPPTKEACQPRLLQLGENEVLVSSSPYGYCSYCCPMNNPAKFVKLYFTNKANSGNTVRLKMGRKPGAVRAAGVNNTAPTVIFIHGFTEYGLGNCPRIFRDAYLSREENYNIILVDWGDLCPLPWYPQAAANTKHVASVLAKFIQFYDDTGELPISNIHIIGFSLGAHIGGFIGKYLRGTKKIARITALDPARPLFPINDEMQRISKNDADYVDVIHTDAGKFGFPTSIGHADFYPNGGSFVQPGCEVSSLQAGIQQFGYCGHLRAWRYYIETVRNPKSFPATKCGILEKGSLKQCRFVTDAYMGFAANINTTLGNFYLTTTDQKPYGKSAEDQERDMKAINLVL